MTPEEFAKAFPKPLESVQAALNLSRTRVLPNGHIEFPKAGTPQHRLFIACLARQPDNEAQRLLRDIRNTGRRR